MPSVGHFALTKTCESNLLCTVESSNLDAIPVGTQITYTYNGDGSDGVSNHQSRERHRNRRL